AVAAACPQRRPGVVRHLARPDEVPERGQGLLVGEAGLLEQVGPEEGAAPERRTEAVVRLALRRRRRRDAAERGRVLAEVERDAVGAGADPDDLAGRAERVELLGPVAGDAPRQHLRLPERRREGERLERDEGLAQARAPADPVPAGEEPRERPLLHRLDLLPQRREGRAAQAAQDVRVAPLALAPAGPQLAADEQLLPLELGEERADVAAEARAGLRGRERAAAARVAEHELAERVGPALEERLGEPGRRHRAERVAVAARVLGRDQPLLASDAHADGPSLREQRRAERLLVLARPQVAAQPEHVVELVGRGRTPAQLSLHLRDRVAVEQVSQLLLAEQLAQQLAVERERLRAPLRRRRVVLVHVGRDVVEEQRARERRGGRGLDLDDVERARLDLREQSTERGQVEDVLQAFAEGLEHDRERGVAACDLEQRLGLQPLLPERR